MTPSKPLHCLIAGFERGGTSLLAQVVRQHPRMEGGFEGGFLLAETPRDFLSVEPFATRLVKGWKVQQEQVPTICDADTWDELYCNLHEASPWTQGTDYLLFDKTPAYMKDLTAVLTKVPGVRCLVIVRDPRAVLYSWCKRSEQTVDEWVKSSLPTACERYCRYAKGLTDAQAVYGERIHIVRYEDFCAAPDMEARQIFQFLELPYSRRYLHFRPRYGNTRGRHIVSEFCREYEDGFSPDVCRRICEATEVYSSWHIKTLLVSA